MRVKYTNYKNSGISWVGEIPVHWQVKRLKHIFKIQKRIAGELGHNVLSITQNGIKIKDINSGKGQLAMDYSKYQRIYTGEFGMNHMDLLTGYVDISKYDGVISPDYRVFSQIDNQSDKNYMLRLLQMCYKQKIFFAEGQGAAQLGRWRMPSDNFKNFLFPVPPKEEQTAIARFLDYKLAKINRFIQKKKQLIKLLNEQKAAIINQAVTKGFDPNAKMKDSGIKWLGEIPEHWGKHKIKYLISKPIAGAWGTEPQNDDNDITCVRVADFNEYEIKTDNLTIRNIEAKTEQILKPGDLLLEKSGGGEKTPVGRVVLFNHSFKAVTSNFVSKFSPKTELISSEYLLYIFKLINSVRWNFRSLKQTTGIQNIDTYQYMDNWVFIPKIEEQRIIVNHIKREFKILDETISKIEKELALTEEYKTALIAEAVTGKIDVRGYEVPEITEEETYDDPDSYREEEEISMAAEEQETYEIE